MSRRGVLAWGGAALVAAPLSACGRKGAASTETAAAASVPERSDAQTLTWKAARKRLEEGNHRFVTGTAAHPDQSTSRRKALAAKQRPFVTVLSCADSRVPPEVVFDQGLGDVFTVRSAGQVVDLAVLGSLQYAIAELATPLLVVLGHSGCGAVKATLEVLEKKSAATGTAIDALVRAITPAVVEAEEMGAKKSALLDVAVDNNVERVVEELSGAKLLEIAVKSRKLKVIGAVYDLPTGEVTFG